MAFIVDVSYTDGSWKAPLWLEKLWDEVMDQQDYERAGTTPSTEIKLTEMAVKGVKVIEDGKVLENVSLTKTQAENTGVADWSIKTNANTVTVVMNNGTPEAKSVASGAAATTNKSDLTTGNATSVKFTVTLTKGADSKSFNVEVPIAAANKDASVKEVFVKGVKAELDATDTTGLTYKVALTSVQAANTTEFILAVTPNYGDASVDYVSATAGTINTDALTEKGALTTAGNIKFEVTPESGAGDKKTYTVNVTIGTASTAPTIEAKTGKATLAGTVLTIPNGITLSGDNYTTYFDVSAAMKDTSVVEITGKTITVTNTESNKS